jgi:hypothetical protein
VDDFSSIARLIEAIRPWLSDLVIIGGWAHRLYRLHPQASPPAYQAVQTRDADVALSLDAKLKGNIAAALRKEGFREDFRGENAPPGIQYRLGDEDQGFYAEFLAPLRGRGFKRDGTPDATLAIAGVTAQKLRHLDLLLLQPWTVRLDSTMGVPLASAADARVPNPVCFIAQKLLIRKDRSPDKQAQDVLYIHDTLELFGGELETLRAEWRDKIRPAIPSKTAEMVERLSRELFGTVDDVIRTAARIPQDRTLTPDRLQAVCAYGLDAIFGQP